MEVINSDTPPDPDWFLQLATKVLGLWGIYVASLGKAGYPPIEYCGEGSEAIRGLPSRMADYDKFNKARPNVSDKSSCPSQVRKALNDGYKIVHIGVLAWMPIPPAKYQPRCRVLCYSMESTFTYLFWLMYSKTMDIEMISCCPWSLDSILYKGGCSHNAVKDPIKVRLVEIFGDGFIYDDDDDLGVSVMLKSGYVRKEGTMDTPVGLI